MTETTLRVSVGQIIAVEFPPRTDQWHPSHAPEVVELIDLSTKNGKLERPDGRWYFRTIAPGTTALVFHERIGRDVLEQGMPCPAVRKIEYNVEVVP